MFVHTVILAALLMGAPPYAQQEDPAIKEFNEQVKSYSDLRKKIAADAPPIDKKREADPEAIVAHEKAVAKGIQTARMNAKEGDIFTPAVQKFLVAAIKQQLTSGNRLNREKRADAREMALGEGNPKSPESKAQVDLKVNAKYPSSAPLSAMPPSLLLKLPKLPEGLEYRFVGKHLILFDIKANLIADILRNAVR